MVVFFVFVFKRARGEESKTKLNTSSVLVFVKEERRIVLTSVVKMMVCWRGSFLGKSRCEI